MVGQRDIAHLVLLAQDAQHALQEVLRVLVCVKSHEVGAEQAFEKVASPARREQPEDLKRRERDMKKKAHRDLRDLVSQHAGEKHEVIVLDPDDILRLQDLEQRVAEFLIYLLIRLPEFLFVGCVGREIVEEGPNGLVAESPIELLHVRMGQEDRI